MLKKLLAVSKLAFKSDFSLKCSYHLTEIGVLSSRTEVLCKKGVLKISKNCEFCEIFKNTIFYRKAPVAVYVPSRQLFTFYQFKVNQSLYIAAA